MEATNDITQRTKLVMGQHYAPDLAEKVMSWSRRTGNDLNSRQRAALKRYRRRTIYDLRRNSSYSDKDILRSFFDLFDDLYFGGYVKDRCKLAFSSRSARKERASGDTDWKWNTHGGELVVQCTLILYNIYYIRDREKRLRDYLGTLLHEMGHAFLSIYGYVHKSCKENINSVGKAGHGYAWQDISYTLAKVTRDRSLLGLKLKLGRCESLCDEVNHSRVPVPCDLWRWGMENLVRNEGGKLLMDYKNQE